MAMVEEVGKGKVLKLSKVNMKQKKKIVMKYSEFQVLALCQLVHKKKKENGKFPRENRYWFKFLSQSNPNKQI
jgi:hypothetical protein